MQLFFLDLNIQSPETSKSISSSKIADEINSYQAITITSRIDPLEFWLEKSKFFPILGEIVERIFTGQGTSTPSERLFSCSGYQIWDSRICLSPNKTNNIVVLHQFKKNKLKNQK